MIMRRLALPALALASTLGLAACGSATVENDGGQPAPTSVAPLEREGGESSGSGEDKGASESADASSNSSESSSDGDAQDRGAREISSVPSAASEAEGADADFLGKVNKAGVRTDGVEDQVIAAAKSTCKDENSVTVQAVAGQLIEQGRTKMEFEQVAGLIKEEARTAYC